MRSRRESPSNSSAPPATMAATETGVILLIPVIVAQNKAAA